MFIKTILGFSICVLIINQSLAQKSTHLFDSVKKKYFNLITSEKTDLEADGVFQKYKRWEYYWEHHLTEDGRFPEDNLVWKELENRNKIHNNKSQLSVANWTFEGPSSISSVSKGGLGRVNCMAFHPSIFATFWVGTADGGLWKTTDAGVTWSTVTDNLPVLSISDIAIDYTNPNIMYIATGDADAIVGAYYSLRSVGVLKSIDGGNTWNSTGLTMSLSSQKTVSKLIIDPINPQILIATTSDGIYRTTNGGTTWINNQVGFFKDLEFNPANSSIVYSSLLSVSGTAQIYRSSNNGINWNPVTAFTGISRIDLAVTPSSPNFVSALCVNTNALGGLYGIYQSINSGLSFSQTLNGTCTNNMLCSAYNGSVCGGQGFYDLTYAIAPNNVNEMWLGGIQHWKTINSGLTWNNATMSTTVLTSNPMAVPYVHSDKHYFAYHPLNSNYIYSCHDGGINMSNDGGTTWQDISNGLGISQIYRLGTSATVNDKVLIGTQDNGLKLKTGSSYTEIFGGDAAECIIDPTNSSTQYAENNTGYLYRTSDDWATRTVLSTNIPGFSVYLATYGIGPGSWLTPVSIDPQNNNTLYMAFNDVWKTTNQGNTWSQISNLGSSKPLQTMVIAPSNNQIIYTATYDTLYGTGNGGLTWAYNTVANITGNANHKISYLTVNPTNPLMIWITISGFSAGNKVFKSTNGGGSWTNISGTLPNIPVNCSVYQNGSNDGIYIGTELGVYYNDNVLNNWVLYNTGLPNVSVSELEISYNTNKLWAATYGRGLWKSDLFAVTDIDKIKQTSQSITIYPNPTEGIVHLIHSFNQPIVFEVYDVIGNLVLKTETTHNESTIQINSFSNGIYFFKFHINNQLIVKKVIVRK